MTRFADADEQRSRQIRDLLGSAVTDEKHIFEALNEASLEDGVFLDIAPDTAVAQPVQVIWVSRSRRDVAATQRLLVRAGRNSSAQLVEIFMTEDREARTFTNGITELLLEDGARLSHSRLHLEVRQSMSAVCTPRWRPTVTWTRSMSV